MKQTVLTSRPRGVGSRSARASLKPSPVCPSTFAPEDDMELQSETTKFFRLLDLPLELRLKIYSMLFEPSPDVIDLDPDNCKNIHRHLAILYVSRQLYQETSHLFYSTKTFRIFPCHPGRFFKTKRPLLTRLSPRCRSSLTSLELRLGPGFANPPKGWAVTDALGLKDAVNVRMLKVMVQVDTSNPIFNGFRAKGADEAFYELFSKSLLDKILVAVPSIMEVQFDAWSSVQKDGAMMSALLGVVNHHRKLISWGPERGWGETAKTVADFGIAKHSVIRVLPEVAVIS